ncbi:hypothetical protein [Nocardia rhizosphaerae]|uniref:RDD family protein n=1 Tax=Nocardia rhizosphaerae TaxID=1691571 RepID=A0ABV8L567_9NOCA
MNSDAVADYPKPAEWDFSRWTDWLATVFFGGMGIFVLLQVPGSMSSHQWIRVAFFVSLGLGTLAMGVLPWAYSRKSLSGARLSIDGRGVLIDETAILGRLTMVSTSCLSFGAVVFIVWMPSGSLGLPLTGGQRVFFPIVAGVIAVYGLIELARAVAQAPIGRLVMTPEEVSFKQTSKGRITLAWSDISEIALPTGKALKWHSVSVKCDHAGPGRGASLDARWPSIGCAATYWLVRFYQRHPELREELADRRVIDRIESGGLLDPDDPKARMALRSM